MTGHNPTELKSTPIEKGGNTATVGGRGAILKIHYRLLGFHGLLSIHIGAAQMEKHTVFYIWSFLKDPTYGLNKTKDDQSIL